MQIEASCVLSVVFFSLLLSDEACSDLLQHLDLLNAVGNRLLRISWFFFIFIITIIDYFIFLCFVYGS